MTSTGETARVTVTADTSLGETKIELRVPARSCGPVELLPALRTIDDVLVAAAQEASGNTGKSVTCRDGCGVCCRQVVPVTKTEARWVARFIQSLPDDRAAEVRSRFDDAVCAVSAAGLLDRLVEGASSTDRTLRRLAAAYFRLGIPCPFLDNERCSIHPVRPLACREYLVTSPAAACAGTGRVARIPVPGRLSQRIERDENNQVVWIPLVLAPHWAATHPEDDASHRTRTGPQLLAAMLHGTSPGSGA